MRLRADRVGPEWGHVASAEGYDLAATPACPSTVVKCDTQLPVCAGGAAWADVAENAIRTPAAMNGAVRDVRTTVLRVVGSCRATQPASGSGRSRSG
jgi:hypothetical protein